MNIAILVVIIVFMLYNHYKKIIAIAVMLISIISMTVCVNASVGKVNGIKKNVKVSTYKGWVSAKDTKMRKIKYNQGVKISWKKIKNSIIVFIDKFFQITTHVCRQCCRGTV